MQNNSFYFQNIMKQSIDRVEILRGNQSSLYGPNAIGGTIHIFTKKGGEGNRSNLELETGSYNTKNLFYSVDGANNNFNYYLGLNKFMTDGISAMNHNVEEDEYKNEGITGTVGYKFNKSLGVFLEGKYNKYWNRSWHNFSVGINYVVL